VTAVDRPVRPDGDDTPRQDVYVYVRPGEIERSQEPADGVIVDYATDGSVVGVEVLDVTRVTINNQTASAAPAPVPDGTARPEMPLAQAEGWFDYWETVGVSSDPAALDERAAARAIRAELARLRASAAPEASPDACACVVGSVAWCEREIETGRRVNVYIDAFRAENQRAWTAAREARAALAAAETTPGQHHPDRGSDVAAYLKAYRDQFDPTASELARANWDVLDDVLDDYRLHADTGTPLSEHACDGPACCYDLLEARTAARPATPTETSEH
jgi:uncharacterized protein YuzE